MTPNSRTSARSFCGYCPPPRSSWRPLRRAWPADSATPWFRHESPDLWVHGLMLGRKFSRKTERYAELYSQHSARRPANGNTENELTLAIGTRRPITRSGGLRLLAMAGRSAHRATLANGEPSWIAYIGLQVRVVKTENEGDFRR